MVKSTTLFPPPSGTSPVALGTSPRLYFCVYETDAPWGILGQNKGSQILEKKKALYQNIDEFAASNNLIRIRHIVWTPSWMQWVRGCGFWFPKHRTSFTSETHVGFEHPVGGCTKTDTLSAVFPAPLNWTVLLRWHREIWGWPNWSIVYEGGATVTIAWIPLFSESFEWDVVISTSSWLLFIGYCKLIVSDWCCQ